MAVSTRRLQKELSDIKANGTPTGMLFLPALYRYDILHTFLVTRYHPLERG